VKISDYTFSADDDLRRSSHHNNHHHPQQQQQQQHPVTSHQPQFMHSTHDSPTSDMQKKSRPKRGIKLVLIQSELIADARDGAKEKFSQCIMINC